MGICEKLYLMIAEVKENRFNDILSIYPNILENPEDVTVWEHELVGEKTGTLYIFEFKGKEIARFSLFYEFSESKFAVRASEVEHCLED